MRLDKEHRGTGVGHSRRDSDPRRDRSRGVAPGLASAPGQEKGGRAGTRTRSGSAVGRRAGTGSKGGEAGPATGRGAWARRSNEEEREVAGVAGRTGKGWVVFHRKKVCLGSRIV